MWIIDHSGPKLDVIKHVEDLHYDGFVAQAQGRLQHVQALRLVAPDQDKRRYDVEIRGCEEAIAEMDKDDRALFERVRAYVIAELATCRTSHAGVTARKVSHPSESDPGRTIAIHVSEYDVE